MTTVEQTGAAAAEDETETPDRIEPDLDDQYNRLMDRVAEAMGEDFVLELDALDKKRLHAVAECWAKPARLNTRREANRRQRAGEESEADRAYGAMLDRITEAFGEKAMFDFDIVVAERMSRSAWLARGESLEGRVGEIEDRMEAIDAKLDEYLALRAANDAREAQLRA